MSTYLSSDDNSNRYKQTTSETSTQLLKSLRPRSNLSPSTPLHLGCRQHLNIVHRTSPLLFSISSNSNRFSYGTQHFIASIHTGPLNDDDENIMEKAVTSLKERKQKKVGYCGWQISNNFISDY